MRAAPLDKFVLAFCDFNAEHAEVPRHFIDDPLRVALPPAPSGSAKVNMYCFWLAVEFSPTFIRTSLPVGALLRLLIVALLVCPSGS